MLDKRCWRGAILVATIAGASALPALLLPPAAPEPMVPATPVSMAKRAEPVVPRVEPQPVAREVPATVLTQPEAAPPAQASVPHRAEPAPVAEPAPLARDRDATPVTFPPVQAVGVAAKAEPIPVAAPSASAAPDRPVAEKPVRARRTATERVTKRKRQVVRPAVYPLREFFAFRR
jgi:hypothetical protein